MTGRYPSEVAISDYSSYVIPAFGFGTGFDVFQTATGDTRAGSLFDSVPAALTWIHAQGDAPWFAFVHGYDAHSPFVQPGPFRHLWGSEEKGERIDRIAADSLAIEQLRGRHWFVDRAPKDFLHAAGPRVLGLDVYMASPEARPGEHVVDLTDDDVTHLRDHYDTGVGYGDVWLGLLLSEIDLDRTVVIVFSDHGEDLLDHGFVNHRAGFGTARCTCRSWSPGPASPARA